ncbi:6-phosphofructo-2-kinase/fructose-2 6-bisphosphatase [Striga asiatica]|uniref:6-phosphofructo-2-kinase/fructose-2 6-bisphosphatase n=1 Tax=Striga asiatica TaxID=4170 RepID=A0A5A7PC46_STRAF|nr:6-phosphofructo-2-kinase/fructose-2 6-bisphosphatase [Striga asiatica]
MGTGASKNPDGGSHGGEEREDHAGGQLYVSLKMENYNLKGELIPHVYGSAPLVGSWDQSKALSMERESTSIWELSFVVPPNHETLDFKFLLKPKHSNSPCVVEEGPNRQLTRGTLRGDRSCALFKLSGDVLEYGVVIKADRVSPFDLAACWRAYQENFQPSTVRGTPDISINSAVEAANEVGYVAVGILVTKRSFNIIYHFLMQNESSPSLELDLEHYVVPAPSTPANSAHVYAANLTETPRSLSRVGVFSRTDGSSGTLHFQRDTGVSVDQPDVLRLESHRGLFVDRGVGSPRPMKSASASVFTVDPKLVSEAKNSMPAAAGAVAAGAVADQMLGPKEDRHLAIVLVGLPARGKTFTAAKLTRYLRWLGHDTKHFNVGKYRRLKHGVNQVAALAMEDMISWMQEGGQVGIFDATNSTRSRRNMLMRMAEGKCKIIFLETICNDRKIIERNIRLKVQQSPDYAEEPDFEAGYQDFKVRLENYEKVYEPVEEGSYIKMIDMVSGHGGQIQVNNISGYLPGRIVFFLVNTHLTPRPILLTRHGESRDNVRGRIGGDSVIRHKNMRFLACSKSPFDLTNVLVVSDSGELYAKKLANFVEKRLKNEKAASIWTSTLQRTILTASPIVGFPKIQWRALDEINAGVCDGMTYEEIKKNMPEEYESRKKDKLRYRYPRGESYLDVIQRLEPVIIELERQRAPVVVISHQAVLRALYAYFADRPLKEIPHLEMPLHTIIEIQMGVTGVQEKRYKLM